MLTESSEAETPPEVEKALDSQIPSREVSSSLQVPMWDYDVGP